MGLVGHVRSPWPTAQQATEAGRVPRSGEGGDRREGMREDRWDLRSRAQRSPPLLIEIHLPGPKFTSPPWTARQPFERPATRGCQRLSSPDCSRTRRTPSLADVTWVFADLLQSDAGLLKHMDAGRITGQSPTSRVLVLQHDDFEHDGQRGVVATSTRLEQRRRPDRRRQWGSPPQAESADRDVAGPTGEGPRGGCHICRSG